MEQKYQKIWGSFELAPNCRGYWHIGPLKIWATRYESEWRLYTLYSQNLEDKSIEIEVPFLGDIPTNAHLDRFGIDHTTDHLIFSPVMSDRPIVIRPEIPFHLPNNEQVSFFVSTPLWLKISYKKNDQHEAELLTIPIVKLSDTWFGPDPTEGEFCYASFSFGRLRYEDLKIHQYRAITAIYIQNYSHQPLHLERIKVPIPHLNLYKNSRHTFFTDDIIFTREKIDNLNQLSFRYPEKKSEDQILKVAHASLETKSNLIMRTVRTLING